MTRFNPAALTNFNPAQERLYEYWLQLVRVAEPEVVLDRFRSMFIDGLGYPEPAIFQDLVDLVDSKLILHEYRFILNRVCHILVNNWLYTLNQTCITKLVTLLTTPPRGIAATKTARRIRKLTPLFSKTAEYTALRYLAQVVDRKRDTYEETTLLIKMVYRYPCLYEHTLLTPDSTVDQRQTIDGIREKAQRKLEVDLSQYATYQRLRRSGGMLSMEDTAAQDSTGAVREAWRCGRNPTLLTDMQLDQAIQTFAGKVKGTQTHRDLASQFLASSRYTHSYRTFKGELFSYLTDGSSQISYGGGRFTRQLEKYLNNLYLDRNDQRLDEQHLLHTSRKLLDFLIVDYQTRDHFLFMDLTNNIGVNAVVALLLKIVLLCRQVKTLLERRFARLFNHYEDSFKRDVDWLVSSLEHLNVALSVNFGRMDLAL